MNKVITFTDELYDYLLTHTLRETDAQRELRERTAEMPEAELQIAAEQSSVLALLARLVGAKRAIEIGVFTGYSALTVAQCLPPDGTLIACDVSDEWTGIGRPFWEQDGVADRIDLRLAPALETLDRLHADGQAGMFDFAFIDADKGNASNYYERCLSLVRSGGVICVDNTLWGGMIADPERQDADTRAMREINASVQQDERVHMALVNVGDGMLIAMKK